jgi:hypothetical protein
MTDEQKKSVQQNVLAIIEAGQVKMRPRWHFVLQTALMVTGIVLAVLALLFTGSFIVFLLQQNGAWFAPAFGGHGLVELFLALPLIFIAIAIVFIILLQILVRRYEFGYGRPVLYSVIGITIFVVAGSFLIAQTGLHEGLFMRAQNQHLPIAGGFYRQFGEPDVDHLITGIITKKTDNGFIMVGHHNEEYTVTFTADTQFPQGSDLEIGKAVVVLGDRDDNNITADGVEKVDGREDLFRRPMEEHMEMHSDFDQD